MVACLKSAKKAPLNLIFFASMHFEANFDAGKSSYEKGLYIFNKVDFIEILKKLYFWPCLNSTVYFRGVGTNRPQLIECAPETL